MYTQIKLNYDFNALEPHVDALTMETHYSKHHAAYTNNLNAAIEKANLEGKDIVEVLSNLDSIEDKALKTAIRNNGGGFYNHNLYFDIMTPNSGEINPEFKTILEKEFRSLENLIDELSKLAAGQFGSGWAWLYVTKDKKLAVSNTPNQDNPLMDGSGTPILGIDVWEHAYYLKYKNVRADYVKAFFNVLDWNKVYDNYKKAI